jgi:hypothetical protein
MCRTWFSPDEKQHVRYLEPFTRSRLSIATGKAPLSTCKVRTPVRIVYHERGFHATQWSQVSSERRASIRMPSGRLKLLGLRPSPITKVRRIDTTTLAALAKALHSTSLELLEEAEE